MATKKKKCIGNTGPIDIIEKRLNGMNELNTQTQRIENLSVVECRKSRGEEQKEFRQIVVEFLATMDYINVYIHIRVNISTYVYGTPNLLY